MAQPSHIKGIRIQTINLVMLGLSLVMFAAVLYATHLVSRTYDSTLNAIYNFVEWERSARTINAASDYLTDQVKLFASTKERQYADNYFQELYETKRRENTLNLLAEHKLHSFEASHDCDLKKAIALSDILTEREIYAIRLMAEAEGMALSGFPESVAAVRVSPADRSLEPGGKIARARELLFGRSYQDAKDNIKATLNKFINETMDNMFAEQKAETAHLGSVLLKERTMLVVLCFFNVITFAMMVILIVRPLKIYMRGIQNDSRLEAVGAYEFKHFALTYNDVFALKEHNDKMLRYRAEHDPLTGLYNRAAYESMIALLRDKPSAIGLLLVDVDKFKEINDTYGHKTGDLILCKVAGQLTQHFRADDYCIRLGGDEFAVIFHVNGDGVETIIREKITNINHLLLHPDDHLPPVSLSVGAAISRSGFSGQLYDDADAALYRVKAAGRCGCQFFAQKS